MTERNPSPYEADEEGDQLADGGSSETDDITAVTAISPTCAAVLKRAESFAQGRGSDTLTTDHVFAAMVTSPCAAASALDALQLSGEILTSRLAFILGGSTANATTVHPELSPKLVKVLEDARLEAGRYRASEVSTLHLLSALVRARGVISLVLETPGLGLEPVGSALRKALREGRVDP
ncbi:MAG: Clp protease N-terminal domain-containing protein [Thermomicrobiales bacterium]